MFITIQFSPFTEMLASMHVLCNSAHHPYRRKWAEETERLLPKQMLKEIRSLGSLFYDWFYVVNICNEYQLNEENVEEAIEFICSMPHDPFLFYLLGERFSLDEIKEWRKDNRTSPLSNMQKDLVSRPGQWQSKLQELFYEYNKLVFARELFRIQPWITAASRSFQQKLDSSKIWALNEIHPDITVDSQRIKVQKGETYQFTLKEYDHITLQPSTFITPHVMLGVYPGRICLGLHIAVPDVVISDEPPVDLILMLKALGEATRFKILRDVLYHPYSTKQLAETYGLTEATISGHIKLLQQAGLVSGERKGYYVFYSGNRERMEGLRADISQFIAMPLLEQFIYEADKT
ncbi:ArsR/SmtB family transcription factor [Peribacillus deserti]|uniref:HTH arsR-type domain-containing protein n=1 Tax=Peribacillus deserti TaxID=673318 RepID=A0A2N5M5L9_9BACI|nr:metalloregulator ArsR/SmtB family transcription factor [Peribacillus deserti]PLT29622.1 hypothetical protein CUU66_12000 [Peribacillus deserti]